MIRKVIVPVNKVPLTILFIFLSQEMSRASTAENNKTAVNIIQEILSRRSIIPTYEILPVEGSLNEPLYQYKLTLDSGTKKYVGMLIKLK